MATGNIGTVELTIAANIKQLKAAGEQVRQFAKHARETQAELNKQGKDNTSTQEMLERAKILKQVHERTVKLTQELEKFKGNKGRIEELNKSFQSLSSAARGAGSSAETVNKALEKHNQVVAEATAKLNKQTDAQARNTKETEASINSGKRLEETHKRRDAAAEKNKQTQEQLKDSTNKAAEAQTKQKTTTEQTSQALRKQTQTKQTLINTIKQGMQAEAAAAQATVSNSQAMRNAVQATRQREKALEDLKRDVVAVTGAMTGTDGALLAPKLLAQYDKLAARARAAKPTQELLNQAITKYREELERLGRSGRKAIQVQEEYARVQEEYTQAAAKAAASIEKRKRDMQELSFGQHKAAKATRESVEAVKQEAQATQQATQQTTKQAQATKQATQATQQATQQATKQAQATKQQAQATKQASQATQQSIQSTQQSVAADEKKQQILVSVAKQTSEVAKELRNLGRTKEARELDKEFAKFSQTIMKTSMSQRELNAAVVKYKRVMDGAERGMLKSSKKLTEAEQAMKQQIELVRNLESASVLALGPLSGLGARIRALGSISSRTGLAMAAFLGTVAGSALVLGKLVKSTITAALELQRLEARLTSVTGNLAAARREFRFLSQTGVQMGVEIQGLAEGYGTLAAAAAGTRLSSEQVRYIFTGVAKAAAALRLDNQATVGTLKALQQMMSKGTVQAEELRQQLGDRLPGAFNLFAKSLGVSTRQLSVMLKQGQVLAHEALPKFAQVLHETYGEAAKRNVDSLQGSLNNLANAQFLFSHELDKSLTASKLWANAIKATTQLVRAAAVVAGNAKEALASLAVGMTIVFGPTMLKGVIALWSWLKKLTTATIALSAAMKANPAIALASVFTRLAVGVGATIGLFALLTRNIEAHTQALVDATERTKEYLNEAAVLSGGAVDPNVRGDLVKDLTREIKLAQAEMSKLAKETEEQLNPRVSGHQKRQLQQRQAQRENVLMQRVRDAEEALQRLRGAPVSMEDTLMSQTSGSARNADLINQISAINAATKDGNDVKANQIKALRAITKELESYGAELKKQGYEGTHYNQMLTQRSRLLYEEYKAQIKLKQVTAQRALESQGEDIDSQIRLAKAKLSWDPGELFRQKQIEEMAKAQKGWNKELQKTGLNAVTVKAIYDSLVAKKNELQGLQLQDLQQRGEQTIGDQIHGLDQKTKIANMEAAKDIAGIAKAQDDLARTTAKLQAEKVMLLHNLELEGTLYNEVMQAIDNYHDALQRVQRIQAEENVAATIQELQNRIRAFQVGISQGSEAMQAELRDQADAKALKAHTATLEQSVKHLKDRAKAQQIVNDGIGEFIKLQKAARQAEQDFNVLQDQAGGDNSKSLLRQREILHDIELSFERAAERVDAYSKGAAAVRKYNEELWISAQSERERDRLVKLNIHTEDERNKMLDEYEAQLRKVIMLQRTLGDVGRQTARAIADAFKSIVNQSKSVLDALFSMTVRFFEIFFDHMITKMIEEFKLAEKFEALFKNIGSWISSALAPVFDKLKTLFQPLLDALSTLFKPLLDKLAKLFSMPTTPATKPVSTGAKGAALKKETAEEKIAKEAEAQTKEQKKIKELTTVQNETTKQQLSVMQQQLHTMQQQLAQAARCCAAKAAGDKSFGDSLLEGFQFASTLTSGGGNAPTGGNAHTGGTLPGPPGKPVPFVGLGGEEVLTRDQARELDKMGGFQANVNLTIVGDVSAQTKAAMAENAREFASIVYDQLRERRVLQ